LSGSGAIASRCACWGRRSAAQRRYFSAESGRETGADTATRLRGRAGGIHHSHRRRARKARARKRAIFNCALRRAGSIPRCTSTAPTISPPPATRIARTGCWPPPWKSRAARASPLRDARPRILVAIFARTASCAPRPCALPRTPHCRDIGLPRHDADAKQVKHFEKAIAAARKAGRTRTAREAAEKLRALIDKRPPR